MRKKYISMRRVTYEEYLKFLERQEEIEVERSKISLKPINVKRIDPKEEELTDVRTTVWSFPKRGSWGTHKGNYRGNWPPQMARALISKYTEAGDLVLDPMMGSGTTCIEAKLLGRNCVGVDINYNAVILTLHRLYWLEKALEEREIGINGKIPPEEVLKAKVEVYHGDARNLDKIKDNSVDLIATHPPYFNIIKYSKRKISGDLSTVKTLEDYLTMIYEISKEAFRVLKPGKYMGILVGDTRIHRHYVPLTHYVLQAILKAGFILKEEVIKIQHRMKSTREKWSHVGGRDFLLIYHEKLFILRKPENKEEYRKYKYSSSLDLDFLES